METTNNEEFCRQVIADVSDRIALELVSKVLNKERAPPNWERESAAFAFLTREFDDSRCSELESRISMIAVERLWYDDTPITQTYHLGGR